MINYSQSLIPLHERYPPLDLEAEAAAHIKRLQDEHTTRRNAVIKKYANLNKPISNGTGASKLENYYGVFEQKLQVPELSAYGWSMKKVLFVTAPVVIGILVLKYLHSQVMKTYSLKIFFEELNYLNKFLRLEDQSKFGEF